MELRQVSKAEFWNEEPDEDLVPDMERDIDLCAGFEKAELEKKDKRTRIDRNNPKETMNPGGSAWTGE